MNKQFIYKELLNILDEENIKVDEPMKKHISFKVGGPADFLVKPKTEEELSNIIAFAKRENVPFIVIGNGSNLLVKDGGIRGIVIELSDNFNNYEIDGNIIKAQSGALLAIIGRNAMKNSLTGFEFAAGIPGTLGGALAMNAGAYGGEMKNIVESVRIMDEDGNIKEYSNEEMAFSYRHSRLSDTKHIALSARIKLQKGIYEDIKEIMDDLRLKRTSKQPLEYPSAGSTFKRPEGYFAGKLIQDSDLNGYQMGGAQVSSKHSGFIINYDKASAKDIINLIDHVKERVFECFGVRLEEEVKILGEDEE